MAIDNAWEIKQSIHEFYERIEALRSIFDIPALEKRLADIEKETTKDGFWDDPDAAAALLKERSALSARIEMLQNIHADVEDTEVLFELAEEEDDPDAAAEVQSRIKKMRTALERVSIELMLSGEDDSADAIVSINAGAGGTDSQDWAEILLRMYTRWVEHKGYKLEMIDVQPGEEAGIKSATFRAQGKNAFGYLKNETGVHRLVRISPFNASGKRHTSFASVFVCPMMEQDIEVDIDEKDLRVDVFRASGAGGQHVNKTSSAVRITHLPTGVVVQCQQEKSQARNKEIAMNVLRSRLHQLEKAKQDEKMQEMHDQKDDIAWGNQIRSYVLHPYQKIKDHRVDLEIGDVNSVLDGDIDPFINAVLLQ
ncbi:MAG: peptide chain release factor 2 [Thermodesulfobacteriota bacterium]|nr:peptide chain release factor 2 [Thermodesulfobacteriota bacterium]